MDLVAAQAACVDYAQKHMALATTNADWSKVDEDEFEGPHEETFEHMTLQHTDGTELHAVCYAEDEESLIISEGGTLLYDLWEDPLLASYGAGLGAIFCPKSLWDRSRYVMMDVEHEHQAAVLMAVFDLPKIVANEELEEGQFALPGHIKTMADAHNYLQKLGYEYTDMTTAREAAATAAPARSTFQATDTPAAVVIQAVIDALGTGGGDLYLGQLLVDEFAKYDIPDLMEKVTLEILARAGVPNALHNTFAAADRDEVLKRLTAATQRHAANMPAMKAAPALEEAKKWRDAEPADITGMAADVLYRQAIRGKVPQIAAIGWCWDDEYKGGAIPEEELAWYCGYVGHDGRLMRDLYIPDKVFEGWFPEYKKVTWNDYEPKDKSNYHSMPMPKEEHIPGVRALLASRYADRGAIEVPDMVEAPLAELMPISTAVPTRPAGFAASGVSHIETLKAFPPGHTGVAAPVASPVAAPTSVSTKPGTENLWREYQLDINSLKSRDIERAVYQIFNKERYITFVAAFVDSDTRIVESIPQQEIVKLFSEYRVEAQDDEGRMYRIDKLFGQSLEDLEKVVRERLQAANVFDAAP